MHARLILVGLAVIGFAAAPALAQTGATTSNQPAPLPDRATSTTTGVGGPTGTRNALGNGQTTGAGMTGTGMPGQGNLSGQAEAAHPRGHDAQDIARTGAAETTASTASTKR